MKNRLKKTQHEMENKTKKYDITRTTVTRHSQRNSRNTKQYDDKDSSRNEQISLVYDIPFKVQRCYVRLTRLTKIKQLVDIHSRRLIVVENGGKEATVVSNIEETLDLKPYVEVSVDIKPEIEDSAHVKPGFENLFETKYEIEDSVDIETGNEDEFDIISDNIETLNIGDLVDVDLDIEDSADLEPDVENVVDEQSPIEPSVDLKSEIDATFEFNNAVESVGSLNPFVNPIIYVNPFKKLEAGIIPDESNEIKPITDNFVIKPDEGVIEDSQSNISKTFELVAACLVNYDVQHAEYDQTCRIMTNHGQYTELTSIIDQTMTNGTDYTSRDLNFSTPDFTGFQYHRHSEVDMSTDYRRYQQSTELNGNENGLVSNQDQEKVDKYGKKKKHLCNICKIGYNKSCNLDAHKLISHPKRIYDCQTCLKSFETQIDLKYHVKNHKKTRRIKCFHYRCDKTFPSRKLRQEHCNTAHRPATKRCRSKYR